MKKTKQILFIIICCLIAGGICHYIWGNWIISFLPLMIIVFCFIVARLLFWVASRQIIKLDKELQEKNEL